MGSKERGKLTIHYRYWLGLVDERLTERENYSLYDLILIHDHITNSVMRQWFDAGISVEEAVRRIIERVEA